VVAVSFGPPPEQVAELFEQPIEPAGGRIQLPDRPGLGLVLDESVVTRLRVDAPGA
jgi:L-alanine-DL-glutamate epimerase-like enolase superfamily enzyme